MAGSRRPPPSLLAVSAVDATGSGLFLAAAVLFFTRSAHLSLLSVGIGLSLAGVIGLFALLPAGAAIARLGSRRTLSVAYLVSVAGYLLYPTVHSVWTFLPLVCALRAADRTAGAATTVLISELVGETDRVHALSVNRAVRNVGWVIGSGLAGVALAVATRDAYLGLVIGNGASYAVGWLLLRWLPPARHVLSPAGARTGGYRLVLRDTRYVAVTGLGALTALLFSIQAVGLPLWVSRRTTAPAAAIGGLFALNAGLVALLQVRAGARARTVLAAGRAYRQAGLLVAAACLLYLAAASAPAIAAVAILAAAVVLLTLGEVLSTAAQFALSLGLARPTELPRYVAFSFIGYSAQDAVGPATVTGLVAGVGRPGWLALAVLVALPAVAIERIVRASLLPARPVPAQRSVSSLLAQPEAHPTSLCEGPVS